MSTNEQQSRVAQPAEEEIKKHGDQLAKQVREAAGEKPDGKGDGNTNKNSGASAGS